MYSSDDEFELSLSSQRGMEAGANRKQKGAQDKLRSEGKALLAQQVVKIDNSAKLQSLRQQLEGLKGDQDKKDKQSKQEQKISKSGTKTREQELAQAKQSAAEIRPDAGQMAKQGEQERKATEEQRREEVATEGG